MTTIVLGREPLSLEDVRACLAGPVAAVIDDAARVRVEAAARTVAELLAGDDAIYGVNTGFGKLASERIGDDDLAALQANLVRSHAAGVGEALPGNVVRLVMVLKAQSLCAGHSGVRVATLELLVDMISNDVLPVIPRQGSVGASGDLAPLAHMTLVMMGEGEAWYEGVRGDGSVQLLAAGLSPARLGPKEGLALLNGTQVSTALALDGLVQAQQVMAAAIVAGAMSMDAHKGSDVPFDHRIHALRPHAGQVELARCYRELMAGSAIRASHVDDDGKVQDPYSFRCQPQVMGACLDVMNMAASVLLVEANAVSDNPLVFPDEGEVLSGGNFHAEPVAFAADMLALAIAEMGALAERRTAELIDTSITASLPPFLTHEPGLNSGYMMAQVTAAALASENKQLASPTSVDSIPTSANQEDHVSMATYGAWRLRQMNANTRNIVAIELLTAAEGIDFHRPLQSSTALEQAHGAIRQKVAPRLTDRVFSGDIAAVCELMQTQVFADLLPALVKG
jgi:histidine ammonia-lyase